MNSNDDNAPIIIPRDNAFRIVCCILSGNNVGTGFFIEKNNYPYLITATHVAKTTNDQTMIIVGNANCNSNHQYLYALSNGNTWKHHAVADISILKMNPQLTIVQQFVAGRCLPWHIFNIEFKAPSRDTELTIFGFPNGLGIHGHFSPLTFRSFASSAILTLPRADTSSMSDFFCMENPACGGYSGGPVMDLSYFQRECVTMTGGGTKCHGIIHGTISDQTGGKIALVTPCFYLRDLI